MNRYMKSAIAIAAVIPILILPISSHASERIEYVRETVSTGTAKIVLDMLKIPQSAKYSIGVVHSSPIGTVSQLKNLVSNSDASAGINGTFFDAYNKDSAKRYPNGILIEDYILTRAGENVCFLSNGSDRLIGKLKTRITGAINGSYKWPNNWYAWSINHVYPSDKQVVIYTSAFGKTPDDGGVNVIVKGDLVTEIVAQPALPPENGYIIHIGKSEQIKNRFHSGDTVEYKVEYTLDDQLFTESIEFAVGAGPRLVSGGKVDVDFDRDGFTEEKIRSMQAARSFIGIHSDGSTIMGTTPRASIYQLADALVKAGLIDAMNLDGGASSGLYFNGRYITKPGREISNALVVIENTWPTAAITIDGQTVAHKGMIREGTTFVPLRGILEQMGIGVGWNSSSHSVTCRKNGEEMTLAIGSGEEYDGFLYQSRSYVPLRIIGERFGCKVSWNAQKKQVEILSQPSDLLLTIED